MKILKSGLVLFVIASVAALALGYVEKVTNPLIAEQERLATNNALTSVMPDTKNFEEIEGLDFSGTNVSNAYIGEGVGYVIEVNPRGYGGAIKMLVGFDNEDKVTGIDIVAHAETPGLGALADEDEFKSQFIGKTPELTVVKSDSTSDMEISAITASTITSNAVVSGVNDAYSFFISIKEAK